MHKTLPALALAGLVAALLVAGSCDTTPVSTQQGYTPEQPVAYSHAVHAGHYEIDCQYCHFGAEKGRHAGVPPLSVCMNCHTQVKTDSPEIQKLAKAWQEQKPIQWVRVHRLPDHAFFNHSSHVTAGLQCQECHGPVQEMVRVEQVQDMSMGWCLDCHRRKLGTPEKAAVPPAASGRLLASAEGPTATAPVTPAERNLSPTTDCSGCHR